MARADLLIDIVRAGAEGNQEFFRRAVEALISGGRSKEPLIGWPSISSSTDTARPRPQSPRSASTVPAYFPYLLRPQP